MKARILFSVQLILIAACLFLTSGALAATSDDYYQAGLTLYNAKNYDQSVQYFSAALQLDPTNAAALQGRANCEYAQGNYPAALADYQKVLSQNPNNAQLSQFVQALQAKVGSAPALPAAPGAAADPFAQGVALYQQKQYQAAIPLFQQASVLNPNDNKPYYYKGLSEMWVGDSRDGALDLALSNKKQPSPALQSYVDQLMARLSPADQQWVNAQLSAPPATAAAGNKNWAAHPFGVRLMPSFVLISMDSLNSEAQAGKSYAAYLQQTDYSIGFNASVPSGYANLTIEPFYKLGSDFELGLPICYGMLGSFNEGLTSSLSNSSQGTTVNFSAFSVGLEGRYYFSSAPMRFFIAGGPMVIPISLSSPSSAGTTSISPSAMGIGAEIQLGMDYSLGDFISVGPFLGYQYADVSGFTATVGGQSAEMYLITNPGTNEWPIITYGSVGSAPSGTKPFDIDLSGLFFGLEFSASF